MNPVVNVVAADAQGVIANEVWRATKAACPRCANNHGNVWALWSYTIQVMGQETRIFLCISCQFTAVGLNGFKPDFDTSRRCQQIIQYGFEAEDNGESISDSNSGITIL